MLKKKKKVVSRSAAYLSFLAHPKLVFLGVSVTPVESFIAIREERPSAWQDMSRKNSPPWMLYF